MRRYRYGYRLIWIHAGRYVRRLKNFAEPGSFDRNNQHGGEMPALPGDVTVSGRQAATIK